MIGSNKAEVDIFIETFPKIGFNKFSFGVGYNFKIPATNIKIPLLERYIDLSLKDRLVIVPMVEFVLIDRHWQDGDNSCHLSVAGDISFRYKVTDNLYAEWFFNLMYRTDLQYKYNDGKWIPSNYIGVIYKFDLKR